MSPSNYPSLTFGETSAYYADTQYLPYSTSITSSLVPRSLSSSFPSPPLSEVTVVPNQSLARIWASDQNPEARTPSPTKIALSHILLGAILLWENGSLALGHYLQQFFSPLAQLRLNRPVQSMNKSFLTNPFGPFVSLNFLLTHHLKQFALGIIIPDRFNQREKRLMHNLVSARAGSVKKFDRQSATLIPLTPLDNLPGLCTTIIETEVSFLLNSGSLFNLINGSLLDLICEETSLSFPTFQHNINLKAHNGSSLPLRKKGTILPVTLHSSRGPKTLNIPFLIEDCSHNNSVNIIGLAFMSQKRMILDLCNFRLFISCPNEEITAEPIDDLEIDPNFNFSALPQKCIINHTMPKPTRFSYFCKVPLLSNFNGTLEVTPCSCPFCKTTHGPETECESALLNSSWIPNSPPKFNWDEIHDIPSTVQYRNGGFQLDSSMQIPLQLPVLVCKVKGPNQTRPVWIPPQTSLLEHEKKPYEPYFRYHSHTFRLPQPIAELFELEWPRSSCFLL